MKKIFTLLAAVLISSAILLPNIAMAQSPEKMSYQSIIRNSSDLLLTNQALGMQISILQGSTSGTAVYVETQNPTSNINGLVSLEIGTGTVLSGNFSAIDWANGPYYIKTEIDPNGGASYTIAGTSQMLSVPYALYGEDADSDPTNELDNTDNQTLSFNSGTRDLSITGGNSVTIPASIGDNWGTQSVASNSTLTGNGTTASPLIVNGDLTDDQTLSISGSNLTIVGGNTVTLPSAGSTLWTANGTNIYNNNSGYVGLGVTSPAYLLDLQASTNAYLNIEGTSTGASYGGILLNRPNTSSKMRLYFQTASSNKWGIGLFNTSENLSITRNSSVDDGTFHIDHTDGFIGIGTTSPLAMLHVAKTTTETEAVFGEDFGYDPATDVCIGNSTGDSYLYLGQGTSNKGYIAWEYNATAANAILKIGTYGGSNDIVLQNFGGNVGVGDNPDCKFHVTGAEMRLSHSTTSELSFYRSTTEVANITAESNDNLQINTVNSGGIYMNSQDKMNFNTSGGLTLALTAAQKVGIGTTNPSTSLSIKQHAYTSFSVPGDAGISLYSSNSATPWTIYHSNNYLSFAYDNLRIAYINSTTGAWTASSDRRLKENITNIESVLDRVNQLQAVRYNFIGRENSNTIGFIAQDVLPLFPEVVSKDEGDDGYYGIAYGNMSIIAIQAIQEQQVIIDEQETKINDLQKQIDELREIIIND